MLTQPKPKLLQHAVMDSIETAIWSGELEPGMHIIESEIAKTIHVSRGSVREALRHLELKGLVQYCPYKGFFVTKWTHRELQEVQSLRILLERFAVRLAASRITESEIAELKANITQMHEAAWENNFGKLVQLDAAFHSSIARYSGHGLLYQLAERFSPYTKMFIALSKAYRVVFPDLMAIADTHIPIVQVLESHDAERAESIVEQHILEVGEAFLKSLD